LLKKENIFLSISSKKEFEDLALETFHFQYKHNKVYKQWVDLLKVTPSKVKALRQLPFLPIEFFKRFEVISSPIHQKTIAFTSSATTSQTPSTHYVNDVSVYEASFLAAFKLFYGNPSDFCILALLPSYLQRKGSSLVYMCERLITESQHPFSGFFLDDISDLIQKINHLKNSSQKVLLIGVSYALMDLCDAGVTLNDNFMVMETGGMKGTRKELLKQELHAYLKKGFELTTIHSEYGMTELLSQAYSLNDGEFQFPPWMNVLIREVDDPLKIREDNKTGGINVIDLANIYSCSFIATKDLGRVNNNNRLELMGRYDNSDVRGCNLMLGNF
jgi:phenylacetate-coenzyme A ligase PaaK-like adenylate-forming protein